MPGDVDVLAVVAEVCGTADPMAMVLALEEQGVSVTAAAPGYNRTEHEAALAEFTESMDPMWAQANDTRKRLIADGWSEEMAEHLASHIAHLWVNVTESSMMGDITVEVAQRIQEGSNDA